MNKEKIFNNVFWFALGSVIALFVLASDVNADTFNYYDTLSINNVYDQVLCSNNGMSNIECFNANGLMYGKATKNYTFVKGTIYTVSFTSHMEYYAIHGQIQTTEIRQNGILFWNANHTVFQYASCIANTTTYIAEEIDIDTLHVDTTYTCATTMNDNFTSFDYINQSSAYNWIGAKLEMSSVEINSIAEGNAGIIENANNNQQQTNDRLDNINDSINDLNDTITSDEDPDLAALGDTAGWLPPGPLDTVLNLPLTILNSLTNLFASECTPAVLPLPYVDKNIELPCVNTLYDKIDGLDTFINWITIPLGAYILFKYFMHLYEWVDNTLTFRENNYIDNWGGV